MKASEKVSQILNKVLALQQQLGSEVSCPQNSCSQPCQQIGIISGAIKKKKKYKYLGHLLWEWGISHWTTSEVPVSFL